MTTVVSFFVDRACLTFCFDRTPAGYSLKLKLKHFWEYTRANSDDSPLYVFDCSFDGDKISKQVRHCFAGLVFICVLDAERF